jgi:hypothetical protein
MKKPKVTKITVRIPVDLLAYVRKYAPAKNRTQSLIIALREWVAMRKL